MSESHASGPSSAASVPSASIPSASGLCASAATTSKEELVHNIKEWISVDNEIAHLKLQLRQKTQQKKAFSDALMRVMKQNRIDCFDINGGSLMYKQSKSKKPLTGKTLLAALKSFYADNPQVAEDVSNHILNSREDQVRECIRRRIDRRPQSGVSAAAQAADKDT